MSNVMFNLVGLVATMFVAYGGGVFVQGQEGLGLTLLGSGSITLGFLLAFALHTGTFPVTPHEEFYIKDGSPLTYFDIDDWLMVDVGDEARWDLPIYISDESIVPADGVFIAWINGRRALVIDRATPLAAETTTVLKPTFTDRSIS